MKKTHISLLILCLGIASTAQNTPDSADVFFGHMKLNEVTVTGVTGKIKMKNSTFPVAVMTSQDLRSAASTNIIDAISHQPGMAQISTGNGISKPVIRGLGYNRIVTLIDGVRQEGQQWGDEHGIEVDGQSIGSVEVLKGPASLIYGSDAMAGVVILNSAPTLGEGTHRGTLSSEYQTNSGLFGYSINAAGNEKGFVWDARYSGKLSHAYKNKYDGYVPGSQFRENAARAMIGLNRRWGHSHLILSLFHQTPSIIE
ncbi:MAG: TonB-dependent receptor plug domain-containing protein, partial [Bacteroidaceae bacterium]|nr:TonB-dependent receptor plug domain-containing protein [Bacteroidaceae bacterium]